MKFGLWVPWLTRRSPSHTGRPVFPVCWWRRFRNFWHCRPRLSIWLGLSSIFRRSSALTSSNPPCAGSAFSWGLTCAVPWHRRSVWPVRDSFVPRIRFYRDESFWVLRSPYRIDPFLPNIRTKVCCTPPHFWKRRCLSFSCRFQEWFDGLCWSALFFAWTQPRVFGFRFARFVRTWSLRSLSEQWCRFFPEFWWFCPKTNRSKSAKSSASPLLSGWSAAVSSDRDCCWFPPHFYPSLSSWTPTRPQPPW